jgi:coenzyme F420-0:L-glutamate ligase / coenzyme F420-1:gamma-L-glutamate ligase
MNGRLEVVPLTGLPEVEAGASLGELIATAAGEQGLDGDEVVVISHKAVSKAEDRVRDLAAVTPGERARALAPQLGQDPRLVELILAQTRAVIRAEGDVLIVETHGGWICANAGIDCSNVPGDDRVALLPEDADASAARIRDELRAVSGAGPAVLIADSFGRPWRIGQMDVAIGCAGLAPLDDWRGRTDADGRELTATVIAVADEVAAAADLIRDKDAAVPAAIVRGLGHYVTPEDGPGAAALRRAEGDDLFR